MKPEQMEMSVAWIKQTIRWFPGVLLGLKRKVGKTRAILELVHEEHGGRAVVFSLNADMSQYARNWYRELYPHDSQPAFVCTVYQLSGSKEPIYVDEWFHVATKEQVSLVDTGRVICRIGTDMETR
jgi:hypothetical protein